MRAKDTGEYSGVRFKPKPSTQFTVLLEPWLGSSHANPGCRGRTVFDSENSALRE